MTTGSPHQLPNATTTTTFTVTTIDLASAIAPNSPGDVFPPVLATSRLVAWMEIAAARLLQPVLQPGEVSVGVQIGITHSAPTPEGAEVIVTATYRGRGGRGGKMYMFEIVARDDGGEIGTASHERAIVDGERLVRGSRRRIEKAREEAESLADRKDEKEVL